MVNIKIKNGRIWRANIADNITAAFKRVEGKIMGCIFSKKKVPEGSIDEEKDEASPQLAAPALPKKGGFLGEEGSTKSRIAKKGRSRWSSTSMDLGGGKVQTAVSRVGSSLCGAAPGLMAAGWPSWLTSVAGEAVSGWVPLRAESFEKLDKIGQGTYSNVYKAREKDTGKIVAMKKVRFVNMDPESVRFMAREILVLRRLDHPNVMKLEGLITSSMSGSLFLVFEYMEHDLAGLAGTPGIKFTESQIKCYMRQLFLGLEHCHSRGILHRDIKGSNLLIGNNGVLKIADFGLANFFQPGQNHPLTSRVVTLWYRAPELLLGVTEYGVAIDMWSAGCILAELFFGKPIMPGRTEVEQMHKIFKLCGSPSEDYWQRKKFPLATSFKPQQPYKRRIEDMFSNFPVSALALVDKLLAIEPEIRGTAASALQSQFFTTEPLPCDPSSLPNYPASKELDIRRRNEEARRQRADAVKGRGPESVRRGTRDFKEDHSPDFITPGASKPTSTHYHDAGGQAGFTVDRSRGGVNVHSYAASDIHPNAPGAWNKTVECTRNVAEPRMQNSSRSHAANHAHKKDGNVSSQDSTGVRKSKIQYSGPLVPAGGNMDDVLKEHERLIQQAVRKARCDKQNLGRKG